MLPSNGKQVRQTYNYHMTPDELQVLFKHVDEHCSMKYKIALLLMVSRGMRPSEALAVNVADFVHEPYFFAKLTFREAKTNKLRQKEKIVKPVADQIYLYVKLNRFRLKEGFLFPFYTKKSEGLPFMDSKTFGAWFSKIRQQIGKKHKNFLDKHTITTSTGKKQNRYRINTYSLRRFFETYLYVNNGFNLAALKEIMEYSSKFDPMKHYIKYFHKEKEKNDTLEETFTPLVKALIGMDEDDKTESDNQAAGKA
ncbi:tyrosine-type recombinase/integrase [Candidatus Woesearchaeota archaeon]|nr:tyrosine-type recombinase/integrase [Candidatus Woesearchaeota archaeon]